MKQVLLSASVVVVSSSSQCDGFNTLDGMKCDGLTKHPEIADQETCKSSCCADASCDTWHWCDSTSCLGWGGAKCWYGTASSCTETKKWVGESKSAPAPAPTPTPSPPSPVTRKRGFSGFLGNFRCEDATLLNLQDSWHYNWLGNAATQGNKCDGQDVSSEFVPMVAGVKCPGYADGECTAALENAIERLNTDDVRAAWKKANARYLLGYNEPDAGNGKHNHPHEVSPADAAAAWPRVQALAAAMDPPLILVAPSVASGQESGGRDCWDENGRSTWMDDFFGNCTDVVEDCDPSLIKYIGMHDYHGSVEGLQRKVDGAAKRYGRKVWITEIAITLWGKPPSMAEQSAYMEDLLPYLDNSDNVFRYAWYSARNAPNNQNGGSNLLEPNGSKTVTDIGKIYRDTPDGSTSVTV